MPKTGTFLGFDFGTKRIGVAVGQALTKTATPLSHLKARDGVPDWQLITKLIQEWHPVAFIVGIPINMDGTDQPVTTLARAFAIELTDRFQLQVHQVDERLTTKAARSKLFEYGGYRALQKHDIDSIAAKIILESWLSE